MDRSIAGTQLISSPELSERVLDFDLRQKNRAQVVMRGGVLGIQLQRLPIELNGIIPVPGLSGLERLRAIIGSLRP